MANMSYCRFQNTLADLKNCYENMSDEPMGADEMTARARLLRLCMKIAADYGDDADDISERAANARKEAKDARAL